MAIEIPEDTLRRFCEGFDEESYLVTAIKKYLRTPEQKAWLDAEDISIEDILNGRVEHTQERERVINEIQIAWNDLIAEASGDPKARPFLEWREAPEAKIANVPDYTLNLGPVKHLLTNDQNHVLAIVECDPAKFPDGWNVVTLIPVSPRQVDSIHLMVGIYNKKP